MIFFTILGYSIQIIILLAFFLLAIFPFRNLTGPRMGADKKAVHKWQRAVKGRKWEKEKFGISDFWFWIE